MYISELPKRRWTKTIAVILIAAFVNQDIVWAQNNAHAWVTPKSHPANERPVNGNGFLKSLSIPQDIAITKEVHRSGEKVIINIQDAHASLGAQESITAILDSLVTNYDLKVVAIEGSVGYIDTSLLKTFPDEKVKKEAATGLVKQGKMSAGEFFAVTSSRPIALYGVEDQPLYRKNVEQFRSVYEANINVLKDINGLESALNVLKKKVYSPELGGLESSAAMYREGKIDFNARWKFISNLADKAGLGYAGYDNLKKFAESLGLEKKIDFGKANRERDALIDVLTKKLLKRDLQEMVLKSVAFKTGKISRGEYYLFLQGLARMSALDPELYPALIAYTDYIVLYESIDIVELFREVKAFENTLVEKLLKNESERNLYKFSRFAELLKGVFEFKLMGDDFDYLSRNIGTSDARAIASFITRTSAAYGIQVSPVYDLDKIFAELPKALEFYRTAEKRNVALLDNTIKRMGHEGVDVAALIAGGYHSKGIGQLLKDKSASYLVVLPKFDASKGDRPYAAILTKKSEPYRGLIKTGQYHLATSAYFAADPDMPESERFVSYAETLGRALEAAVAGVLDESARTAKRRELIGLWLANYIDFYDNFLRAQEERRKAGTPEIDFTPRTPRQVEEFLKTLTIPQEPKAPAGHEPLYSAITSALSGLVSEASTRDLLLSAISKKMEEQAVQGAGIEVEKKFLLPSFPEFLRSRTPERIIQGYIYIDDNIEIRVRQKGAEHFVTVKTSGNLSRREVEIPVTSDIYGKLMPFAQDRIITKDRYSVPLDGGLKAEVDLYYGRCDGLVTLELELPDASTALPSMPAAIGKLTDVTEDSGFKNRNLALKGIPKSGKPASSDMTAPAGEEPSREGQLPAAGIPAITPEIEKVFFEELGIGKEDLARAAQKSPRLVELNPARIKRRWLEELSIGAEDLAKAILNFPQLAGVNPARIKKEWKDGLNIGSEDLARAILQFPRLVALSPERFAKEWKEEFGISTEELAKAILRHPALAGYSPSRIRKEWRDEFGIGTGDLARAILKFPQLTGLNASRVKKRWTDELPIDEKDLAGAISKYPHMAGLNPARIKKEWEEALGINGGGIIQAIKSFPTLLGYSVKNNLKPKIELLRKMGVSEDNIIRSLIDLAIINIKLLQAIVAVSDKLSFSIKDSSSLRSIFSKVDRAVRKDHKISAARWIHGKADTEVLDMIGSVLSDIIEKETAKSRKPSSSDMEHPAREAGAVREAGWEALRNARTIASFLALRDPLPQKADLIIAFGNEYLETVFEAARLYAEGRADALMFVGGIGHSTANLIGPASRYLGKAPSEFIDPASPAGDYIPEARIMKMVFDKEMRRRGFSESEIAGMPVYLEDKSKNCGENVVNASRRIEELNGTAVSENRRVINVGSVILIQQPPLSRRLDLTFKRWKPETVFRDTRHIYNHASLIPDDGILIDPGYVYQNMLLREAQSLETYPSRGFTVPLDIAGAEPGKLPREVSAAVSSLKKILAPEIHIEANGQPVADLITAGGAAQTAVDVPIQVEKNSFKKGSSLTNLSSEGLRQAVLYMKTGSATVTMRPKKAAAYEIKIVAGEMISLFADSDVTFTAESSDYIVFRQTDVPFGLSSGQAPARTLPGGLINGEEASGSIRQVYWTNPDNAADIRPVARSYRDAEGLLEASVHKADMKMPDKRMAMITPGACAIGVGIKKTAAKEPTHKHDLRGESRQEMVLCMEGRVKARLADRSGRGVKTVRFGSGELLMYRPHSVHGIDEAEADIAVILQDPDRGNDRSEKQETPAEEPAEEVYRVSASFDGLYNGTPESTARLTARYDGMDADMLQKGIDVRRFFGNSDYFGRGENGEPVAFTSSSPFVAHHPLTGYEGGNALVSNLRKAMLELENIIGPENVKWTKERYLHSTVYSVRKSIDPQVGSFIDMADVSNKVKTAIGESGPYKLIFSRISVTSDGTILAVGYVNNGNLAALRERLGSLIPEGHRTNIIHITLGRMLRNPTPEVAGKLKDFIARNRHAGLGTIDIDKPAFLNYIGPVTDPRLEKIAPEPSADVQQISVKGLAVTSSVTGLAAMACVLLTYIGRDVAAFPVIMGMMSAVFLAHSAVSAITLSYINKALGKRAGPIAETRILPDGRRYIWTAPAFENLPKFFRDLVLMHEETHLAGFGEFAAYLIPVLGSFSSIDTADHRLTIAALLNECDGANTYGIVRNIVNLHRLFLKRRSNSPIYITGPPSIGLSADTLNVMGVIASKSASPDDAAVWCSLFTELPEIRSAWRKHKTPSILQFLAEHSDHPSVRRLAYVYGLETGFAPGEKAARDNSPAVIDVLGSQAPEGVEPVRFLPSDDHRQRRKGIMLREERLPGLILSEAKRVAATESVPSLTSDFNAFLNSREDYRICTFEPSGHNGMKGKLVLMRDGAQVFYGLVLVREGFDDGFDARIKETLPYKMKYIPLFSDVALTDYRNGSKLTSRSPALEGLLAIAESNKKGATCPYNPVGSIEVMVERGPDGKRRYYVIAGSSGFQFIRDGQSFDAEETKEAIRDALAEMGVPAERIPELVEERFAEGRLLYIAELVARGFARESLDNVAITTFPCSILSQLIGRPYCRRHKMDWLSKIPYRGRERCPSKCAERGAKLAHLVARIVSYDEDVPAVELVSGAYLNDGGILVRFRDIKTGTVKTHLITAQRMAEEEKKTVTYEKVVDISSSTPLCIHCADFFGEFNRKSVNDKNVYIYRYIRPYDYNKGAGDVERQRAQDMAALDMVVQSGKMAYIQLAAQAEAADGAPAEPVSMRLLEDAMSEIDGVISSREEYVDELPIGTMAPSEGRSVKEAVLIIKPPVASSPDTVREVLERARAFGYEVVGARVFDGSYFEHHLDTITVLYQEAYAGYSSGNFSPSVMYDLRAIYDTPDFEFFFGTPFNTDMVIPAEALKSKYGLSEEDITGLWEAARLDITFDQMRSRFNIDRIWVAEDGIHMLKGAREMTLSKKLLADGGNAIVWFRKGLTFGLNKVGYGRNVFPIMDPRVNGGRVVLAMNGYVPGLFNMFKETPATKTVAVVLRSANSGSATWKQLRELFLGDNNDPRGANAAGSVRKDAVFAELALDIDPSDHHQLNGQKNIAHLSAGPLEGVAELHNIFNVPVSETSFGHLMVDHGYSVPFIEYLITDPAVRVYDEARGKYDLHTIFELTAKKEPLEALELIKRYFPPTNEDDPRTSSSVDFEEFMSLRGRYKALELTSGEVPLSEIQPARKKVRAFHRAVDDSGLRMAALKEEGLDMVRQGQIAEIVPGGGTSGRFYGYKVKIPEWQKIKLIAPIWRVMGRLFSSIDIKLLYLSYLAKRSGGRIPVAIMGSGNNIGYLESKVKASRIYPEADLYFYAQGEIPRLNPTDRDIRLSGAPGDRSKYNLPHGEDAEANLKQWVADNGEMGDIFRNDDGSYTGKPPGHFDIIAKLVLSRKLFELVQRGTEVLHIANGDDVGAALDPAKAAYLMRRDDINMLVMLVKKNTVYTVKRDDNAFDGNIRSANPEAFTRGAKEFRVISRNGVVLSHDLPDGITPVIDGQALSLVHDGKTIKSGVKGKLEKGGTFVYHKGIGRDTVLDQPVPGEDFSTNQFYVKTEALLDLFGLDMETYSRISQKDLINRVRAVTKKMMTHVEIKPISVGTRTLADGARVVNMRPAAQFARYIGEMTALDGIEAEPLVMDRDAVDNPEGYCAIKEPEDVPFLERTFQRVYGLAADGSLQEFSMLDSEALERSAGEAEAASASGHKVHTADKPGSSDLSTSDQSLDLEPEEASDGGLGSTMRSILDSSITSEELDKLLLNGSLYENVIRYINSGADADKTDLLTEALWTEIRERICAEENDFLDSSAFRDSIADFYRELRSNFWKAFIRRVKDKELERLLNESVEVALANNPALSADMTDKVIRSEAIAGNIWKALGEDARNGILRYAGSEAIVTALLVYAIRAKRDSLRKVAAQASRPARLQKQTSGVKDLPLENVRFQKADPSKKAVHVFNNMPLYLRIGTEVYMKVYPNGDIFMADAGKDHKSGMPVSFAKSPVRLESGYPLTIGRRDTNRLIIANNSVSRNHVTISLDRDAVIIQDMGSTFGTFYPTVENEKVSSELPGGERLNFLRDEAARLIGNGDTPAARMLESGKSPARVISELWGSLSPAVQQGPEWTGISVEIYEARLAAELGLLTKLAQKKTVTETDIISTDERAVGNAAQDLARQYLRYGIDDMRKLGQRYSSPRELVERCVKNGVLRKDLLDDSKLLKYFMSEMARSFTRTKPGSSDLAAPITVSKSPLANRFVIGMPSGAPENITDSIKNMAEDLTSQLGRKIEIVFFNNGIEDFNSMLTREDLTGLYIDMSFFSEIGENPDKVNGMTASVTGEVSAIIVGSSARDEIERIMQRIKSLLPMVDRTDPDKDRTTASELRTNIQSLKTSMTERKSAIRPFCKNTDAEAILDRAFSNNGPVAIGLTESVVANDIFSSEDMGKVADRSDISPFFIFGTDVGSIRKIMNEEQARDYLRSCGYNELAINKIRMIDARALSFKEIVGQISRTTGLPASSIGVASVEKELYHLPEDPGLLMEVGAVEFGSRKFYATLNSISILLSVMAGSDGFAIESPISGVVYDRVNKVFRYLPRAVPIDYDKELEVYRMAIEIIRTAA